MSEPQNNARDESLWQAYGVEKDRWKAAGNCYTPEELARMAEGFKDLKIRRRRKRIYAIH